eukprot:1156693-Pelagomonas_calceolata.AAC.1
MQGVVADWSCTHANVHARVAKVAHNSLKVTLEVLVRVRAQAAALLSLSGTCQRLLVWMLCSGPLLPTDA